MPKDSDGLTFKQREFVNHYINNKGNGGEAYKAAGYSVKSDNAAAVEASKLLKNPKIQAAIDKVRKEVANDTLGDITTVIQELKCVGLSDITDVLNVEENGEVSLKKWEEIPSESRKAIQEISFQSTRNGVSIKIKMHDKIRSLELIAKIIGLLDDLNVAINIFKRYGYEIQQTADGYVMTDSYKKN